MHVLRQVQLTTWLLCAGFASLCMASLLIAGTALMVLPSSSERAAMQRVDVNMNVAWRLLHELGQPIYLSGGRLHAGPVALDGDSQTVDAIHDLVGGVATIFQGDVRVSTTVRDEEGRRGVGTRLTSPDVENAVLNRRERFRGMVDILGVPYYAGYDPILAPDGEVIGILSVATPKSQVAAAVSQSDMAVLGASALVIMLVGAIFLATGHKLAAQIGARQSSAELARVQLNLALANMANGLSLWDAEGRLVLFNQRLCEILDVPAGKFQVGMTFRSFLEVRHAVGSLDGASLDALCDERMAQVERREAASHTSTIRTGRVVTVLHRPLPGNGWVATYEDVTERHQAAEKIEFMAHHDACTGLGNRTLFDIRLQHALRDAGPGRSRVAVLGLDLDHFKAVNDMLGHAVGDKLLVAVGKRLGALLRGTDMLARLGGDEFAVVLPLPDAGMQACTALAERIVHHLSQSFLIDDHVVVVGVSVGVALFPEHGNTATELLRCADIAMYRAKEAGRGQSCVFEPVMDEQLQKSRALERDLREAIMSEVLTLHYQPLVCCATGRVEGYEALLRWNHPVHGPISPAVFVPLAEETNLILPLGQWVLETACRAAAAWKDPVRVAVNLSPSQFRRFDLTRTVLDTLARTGLAPSRLEVEITEGVLIDDPARAMAMLRELRASGVRVSLDDFGTGYSSLSYLRQFPLDKIKIDKSFIDGMTVDPQAAAIVQALVSLAHTLNLSVTAEGVETAEQLHALQSQLCNQVQGYLLGRPSPGVIGSAVALPGPARDGPPVVRTADAAAGRVARKPGRVLAEAE